MPPGEVVVDLVLRGVLNEDEGDANRLPAVEDRDLALGLPRRLGLRLQLQIRVHHQRCDLLVRSGALPRAAQVVRRQESRREVPVLHYFFERNRVVERFFVSATSLARVASAPNSISPGNFLGTPLMSTASYLRTCACQNPGGSSLALEDEADVVEAAGAGVAGEVALVIFSLHGLLQAWRRRARTTGMSFDVTSNTLPSESLKGEAGGSTIAWSNSLEVFTQLGVYVDREDPPCFNAGDEVVGSPRGCEDRFQRGVHGSRSGDWHLLAKQTARAKQDKTPA